MSRTEERVSGLCSALRLSKLGEELAGGVGEGLAEGLNVLLEAPVPDAIAGVLAHTGGGARGGEDAAEGAGGGGDVADRKEEAFDAVGEEVGVAADVGGEEDGAGGVHDLVDDETPGLVLGGEDEDGGEIEEAGEFGLVAEATEA